MRQTARGFTLVELLVVVAIIAVLASSVLAAVGSARAKARDAKRIAEIKEIKNALNLYHDSNFSYPSTTPEGFSGEDAAIQFLASPESGGFLPAVPEIPGVAVSFFYRGIKEDGSECVNSTDICTKFVLGTTLESSNATLESDSDTAVGTFVGASSDCLGGSGDERCYDVQN